MRYFIGSSVESTTLRQADATTFKDLVQHLIDLPESLSITAAEYQAMSPREKAEAKKVGYVVACTFPTSPWEHGRKLAHAEDCNLIFLDIDAKENDCPAAPFVENPRLLMERLGQFNFAAYRTISSTPECPRMRVMVDARAIPVSRYADAVMTVAHMMGLPYVTRESAVASQPMFRPSFFQGQDPELEHPIVITNLAGVPFTEANIATGAEGLADVMAGTKRHTFQRGSGDDLEDFMRFYQRPIPEVTLETVQDMLSVVSADCSRPAWIEVGAALRHQFPGDMEPQAYQLFENWSRSGHAKFAGEADTLKNWKCLSEQPRGRAPITIRTLIARALKDGWSGHQMKEDCFQSVSNWLTFSATSATELRSEGLRRIAALPAASNTEDNILLQTLSTVSREKFAQKINGLGPLMKDLKKLRDSINRTKDAKEEPLVAPWARGIVYDTGRNVFHRPPTRQVFTHETFNSKYSRELLPSVEELEAMSKEVNETTLNTPRWLPTDYVLNHLKCQTVDDTDYSPSNPDDLIIKREGRLYLNVYRRSYRAPDKTKAAYAEEMFFDHLVNLVKEPHYRRIIVDWMAHNIQFPGVKIRWALFLQGAEGCGKTFLAECMRQVVGSENIAVINNESIKKGWNEWVFGSQIVAIEEIRVAGLNRHDVMNALKEPITNDTITTNERGRNTRNTRNITNYLIFSNHHDALALTEGSRRYCIIKSALQKKAQVVELRQRDPDYFKNLFSMLVTHGPGLRHMLENWTISEDFDADGEAPRTTYLDEMIFDTSNELTNLIQQIWEDDEDALIKPDIVCVSALTLALEQRNLRNLYPHQLTNALRDAGFRKLEKRIYIGDKKQSIWVRSDLLNGQNPEALLRQRLGETLNTEDWM